MRRTPIFRFIRQPFLALAATLLCLSLVLVHSSAQAAGRVQWKSTTLKERSSKSWIVEVTIYLPRPPDTAHVPMKFEFEPTSYFERAMVDGDKLVESRRPLVGVQSMIESVDVGFMDPGEGKIQNRTRFSFKVTRGHGYEAGEYKVTIRDARSGAIVGTPSTLTLQGENEIIDRRAIVFTGEKKKKKKSEPEAEKAAPSEDDPTPAEEGMDAPEDTDSSMEEMESQEPDGPPAIEEKPGGCGCRVVGQNPAPARGLAVLGLFALGASGLLRRRRFGPRRAA